MIDILKALLTLGLKPLYDKNMSYYKIISEFRNKLPRQQNQAKILSEKEKANAPSLQYIGHFMTLYDLSSHKTSVSEAEIDEFYNKINNFNYSFMLFKKHYKNYTRNLNRFNPKAENRNSELAFLQQVIRENPENPLKPFPVFIHHLKYKIKPTLIKFFLKKQRRIY